MRTLLLFIFGILNNPLSAQLMIEFEKELSHKYYEECQSKDPNNLTPNLPVGWGVMAPSILVHNGDQYAISHYGCGPNKDMRSETLCVLITKNGETISESLDLSKLSNSTVFHNGLGKGQLSSNQSPLLFIHGEKLLLIHSTYLSAVAPGYNLVYMHSLDLRQTFPLTWSFESYYVITDGTTFNYLGGAIKDNEIVISGWRSNATQSINRMEIIKFSLQNDLWNCSGPQTVVAYPRNRKYVPLYTHVIITDDDNIHLFNMYQDNRVVFEKDRCEEGTRFHNVAAWKGKWAQANDFKALWSDKTNFNPCLLNTNYQDRFPLDFLCVGCGDPKVKDDIYAVFRKKDVNLKKQIVRLEFPLMLGDSVLHEDIGIFFSPWMNEDMNFISMTHLSDGTFVFLASHSDIKINNQLAIIYSKDLINFSTPKILNTDHSIPGVPIGVGNQIKVAQANKNGSDYNLDDLHFYYSGSILKTRDNFFINNNHHYKFYKAHINH